MSWEEYNAELTRKTDKALRKYKRRYRLLKKVFYGRKAQLEAARKGGLPFPRLPQNHQYGEAVAKYVKARTAWRKFRGWE